MGHSIVTGDEFTHTDRVVTHKPSGVELYIYPTLEVVTGTWPTTKKMPNGKDYDLDEIKRMAEVYLKKEGVMV